MKRSEIGIVPNSLAALPQKSIAVKNGGNTIKCYALVFWHSTSRILCGGLWSIFTSKLCKKRVEL
jgi:hypothetical protein